MRSPGGSTPGRSISYGRERARSPGLEEPPDVRLQRLRARHAQPSAAGRLLGQRTWFGERGQWKRLAGNRLMAVAPVYAMLLEVPDMRVCELATEACSAAVEFGLVLHSPLSVRTLPRVARGV
jgi:hypothetical protein